MRWLFASDLDSSGIGEVAHSEYPVTKTLDGEFHPELRRVARYLPRQMVNAHTLSAVRMLTKVAALAVRTPRDVEVEQVGPIEVRLHQPVIREQRMPALLWIHGGGLVLGTAALDDTRCRDFARQLGIVVAAVEYRLAPEHPFPTPLEDCYAALTWLAGRADVDETRIAIGGASAGAGLAAALALLARDRGELRPVFQLLTYPMLDDRTATRTDLDGTNHRMWNNDGNRFGWQSYTGQTPERRR